MPATVNHVLTATTPDNTSYEIRPSHWNSSHALTLNAVGSEISGAFSNANGVSFGLSAGQVTASHNGLTTAAASNHSHGNPTLALTNLSGTTASASNGFTLSLSASAGGAGDGGNILAAGTRTAGSNSSVLFDNANGITFGLNAVNGSVMTASHNALTTARASNDGVGLNTAATQVTWTVNSNGISLNAGAYLTTAMQSNAVTLSNIRVSAGTTSNLLSALTFNNANGITFGLDASTLTASHNGLTTAAASNHSHGNPTLNLTNLSGTTASASNGLTLSLSAAPPGITGVNVSAGTTSNNMTAMTFSNAGGVTFGLNGSVITAAAPAAAAANITHTVIGNTGFDASTATFSGGNMHYFVAGNMLGGFSTGALSHSLVLYAYPNTIVAGTTQNTNASIVSFVDSNGVSFGINGVTVTASVKDFTLQDWDNAGVIQSMNQISNITATRFSRGRLVLFPVTVGGHMLFNRAMIEMSRATSGNNSFTINFGLYSFNNSTQIGLVGSAQNTFGATNTASVSGIRRFLLTHAVAGMSSLTPGHYIGALGFSASNDATVSMNYSLRGGLTVNPPVGIIGPGADQNTTANLSSVHLRNFWGFYTATTANPPANINMTQVDAWTTGAMPYFWMGSR